MHRVGPGCYVVQRPGAHERQVIRLGDGHLGTHLLVEEARARRDPTMLQKRLGEYLLREQVGWVLRATEANLVIDAGAHVGGFGRALRRAGYRGRIVSFEPVRAAYDELCRRAGDDPDWQVHELALGDRDGAAELHVVPGTMSSFLRPNQFAAGWNRRLRRWQDETVRVARLDGLWEEVTRGLEDPRVFLKMDTQGYDGHVFSGAAGVLDQVVALQSELACVPLYEPMTRLPEQLVHYEAHGFETVGMFPVARDRETLRVLEYDVVMVRPGQVRRPRG